MSTDVLEALPPGQLEFEFEGFGLGSLEEAQEIFDAVGDHFKPGWSERDVPEGWVWLGSGGSRNAYLSPSGVVYKIQHDSSEAETPWNRMEIGQFARIRKERSLPPSWRVPKTHLYSFRTTYTRYNRKLRKEVVEPGTVHIVAMEYVAGQAVGCGASTEDRKFMAAGFDAAGLFDSGGANAIKALDGSWYIIDAGESESTV